MIVHNKQPINKIANDQQHNKIEYVTLFCCLSCCWLFGCVLLARCYLM